MSARHSVLHGTRQQQLALRKTISDTSFVVSIAMVVGTLFLEAYLRFLTMRHQPTLEHMITARQRACVEVTALRQSQNQVREAEGKQPVTTVTLTDGGMPTAFTTAVSYRARELTSATVTESGEHAAFCDIQKLVHQCVTLAFRTEVSERLLTADRHHKATGTASGGLPHREEFEVFVWENIPDIVWVDLAGRRHSFAPELDRIVTTELPEMCKWQPVFKDVLAALKYSALVTGRTEEYVDTLYVAQNDLASCGAISGAAADALDADDVELLQAAYSAVTSEDEELRILRSIEVRGRALVLLSGLKGADPPRRTDGSVVPMPKIQLCPHASNATRHLNISNTVADELLKLAGYPAELQGKGIEGILDMEAMRAIPALASKLNQTDNHAAMKPIMLRYV